MKVPPETLSIERPRRVSATMARHLIERVGSYSSKISGEYPRFLRARLANAGEAAK